MSQCRSVTVFMGGEENEQMSVGEDWVNFDVEKEYGGEEDDVLWPHRPKKCIVKRMLQGKMEGKLRRGRPVKTWFQRLDMADASQLVTDRERCPTCLDKESMASMGIE